MCLGLLRRIIQGDELEWVGANIKAVGEREGISQKKIEKFVGEIAGKYGQQLKSKLLQVIGNKG